MKNFIIGLFLFVFSVPFANAAQRNYSAHVETADWSTESKEQVECKIKQIIPYYGEAEFVQRSGHEIQFLLHSKDLFLKNAKVILMSEAAPWRHDSMAFEIGSFKLNKGHQPLTVKSPYASRMFQQIENGMMPAIRYRDMADQKDLIYLAVSPMNFRKHLDQFRQCAATLLEYDPDEIKDFNVYFATNKWDLTATAQQLLTYLHQHLGVDKNIKHIRIDAHADERGRRRFNDRLSEKRAQAVVNYLTALGVDEKMIYFEAHGEREPRYDNKTAAGRAKNRHAQIQIMYTPPPPPKAKQEAVPAAEEEAPYVETDQLNTPVPNFINLDYLNQ